MITLDEQTFIDTIDVLRAQYEYDSSFTTTLENALNAEGVVPYNNSTLTNHIMAILQSQFVPVDGQCEIERYCYELNFGFVDGRQVITPKDLWDSLNSKQSVSMN